MQTNREVLNKVSTLFRQVVNSLMESDEVCVFTFSSIFGEDRCLATAFSSILKTEQVKVWLSSECKIIYNEQQSRGMRREVAISKMSHICMNKVESYFTTEYLDNTVKMTKKQQHIEKDFTPSFTGNIGEQALAQQPVPAQAPRPVQTAVPVQGLIEQAPFPAQTVPTNAPLGHPPKKSRLLSRSRNIHYSNLHKRQLQRVQAVLLNPIRKLIEQKVSIDKKYITVKDILVDLANADSTDAQAAEQRRHEKERLAGHPVVQSQVQNYCAAINNKQEKKRILSNISPDFTLKELNTFVFTPDKNVKVRTEFKNAFHNVKKKYHIL